MMLIYLTQLPLLGGGLWLGVGASMIAGVVGLGILVADSSLPTTAVFAGLNAFPVVLLVRRALFARSDAGGGVDRFRPGLLTAWVSGRGLAVIAAVVLILGGLDGMRAALREALAFDSGFGGNTRALLNCSTRSPSFCLASSPAYRWR
jgi:hypothetical protein